jgi:hypothetical protein
MNPNSYAELDLRKMDAQGSKSASGPDSMDAQEREKDVVDAFRHSMMTILMKRRSDERSDRNYSMADDQMNEFEGTYGVECDPYYEERTLLLEKVFPEKPLNGLMTVRLSLATLKQ